MSEFWNWFNPIDLGNRKTTFTKIFEYLDAFKRPVIIVETGCARNMHDTEEKNWRADGQSTILFDHYVQANGGRVYSVDIDPNHVVFASWATRSTYGATQKVILKCGDSVK